MNSAAFHLRRIKVDRKIGVLLPLMVVLVSLAGCGKSEPKLGDAIREQGIGLADIGDQWTEGDELVVEGRDQIERGQDMINEGERLLETGRDNVNRGQQAKQQAELTYREKTGRELPVIQ